MTLPVATALLTNPVFQLLRDEDLFLGLSSGINIAGSVKYAQESGPAQTIVTILCDSGHKYQPKFLMTSGWESTVFVRTALFESLLEGI